MSEYRIYALYDKRDIEAGYRYVGYTSLKNLDTRNFYRNDRIELVQWTSRIPPEYLGVSFLGMSGTEYGARELKERWIQAMLADGSDLVNLRNQHVSRGPKRKKQPPKSAHG